VTAYFIRGGGPKEEKGWVVVRLLPDDREEIVEAAAT
jgi:hypothetical protein